MPKKLHEEAKKPEGPEIVDGIKKEHLFYEHLTKYGWDHEDKLVKYAAPASTFYRLYLTGLDGIGKHDKHLIDCEFTDNSLDLRLLNFNGKNWRLKLVPLNGLIDPAASKLKVKSNSITLELVKANTRYWDDVIKKKPGAPTKIPDNDERGNYPTNSLMGIMKDLYDNGDESMRRTIAEGWTKPLNDKAKQ